MTATIRSFIFILITTNIMLSFAQISIEVDSIIISNYSLSDTKDYIVEDSQHGPVVVFYCSFHNNSNSQISLKPANSNIYVDFEIDNLRYFNKIYQFRFSEPDFLIINPGEPVHFIAVDAIFLGTAVLDDQKTNYLADLVKVVPNLKIVYYEKDVIRIESKCINKLILK
jgi:hypothetical protein